MPGLAKNILPDQCPAVLHVHLVCPVMSQAPVLVTKRLRLRGWQDADLPAFADLNADPRVMEHFPKTLTRAESDERAARIVDHFGQHGFGLWAVEVTRVADFIGFVGLTVPSFQAHFTPCVEIAWRLAYGYWHKGYATEGARAAIALAFGELGLDEIVSSTVPDNRRSRAVMERLGMTHSTADDFDHPVLPVGHPLRRHVLYRLQNPRVRGAMS